MGELETERDRYKAAFEYACAHPGDIELAQRIAASHSSRPTDPVKDAYLAGWHAATEKGETFLRDLLALLDEPYAGNPVPVAVRLIREALTKTDERNAE